MNSLRNFFQQTISVIFPDPFSTTRPMPALEINNRVASRHQR